MFKRRPHLEPTGERGFTIIELLVVIILVGILLAIAVPSYIGFRDRAANNAAKANLRDALTAAETYRAGRGTYVGMTANALVSIDSGLPDTLEVVSSDASTYCLTDTVSGRTWSVAGPDPTSADFHPSADCT